MSDPDEEFEDRLVTSLLRVVVPFLDTFDLTPRDLTDDEFADLAAAMVTADQPTARRIILAAVQRKEA